MSLSTKYLSENKKDIVFSIDTLAMSLKKLPEISFAYLLGSAQNGIMKAGSDLDIAIFMDNNSTGSFSIYRNICDCCSALLPGVRIDLGLLNQSQDPVYKYESIKGKLLFAKDTETWLRFFSVNAREYDSQMSHYRKQQRYRMELTNQ